MQVQTYFNNINPCAATPHSKNLLTRTCAGVPNLLSPFQSKQVFSRRLGMPAVVPTAPLVSLDQGTLFFTLFCCQVRVVEFWPLPLTNPKIAHTFPFVRFPLTPSFFFFLSLLYGRTFPDRVFDNTLRPFETPNTYPPGTTLTPTLFFLFRGDRGSRWPCPRLDFHFPLILSVWRPLLRFPGSRADCFFSSASGLIPQSPRPSVFRDSLFFTSALIKYLNASTALDTKTSLRPSMTESSLRYCDRFFHFDFYVLSIWW